MISLKDLNLETKINSVSVEIAKDAAATVRTYLPMTEKVELLQYVLDNAIDDNTGCFSPVRLETYFILGVMKYYTDIDVEIEGMSAPEVYDLLETNDIVKKIVRAIPADEFEFISQLLKESAEDAQKYNTSAAGIINNMSGDANNLDTKLSEIISNLKSEESLDLLNDIKNFS